MPPFTLLNNKRRSPWWNAKRYIRAIICYYHAFGAMDSAYPGNDSSSRYFIARIDFMASEGGELQKGRIRVNEGRDTTNLADQKANDRRTA